MALTTSTCSATSASSRSASSSTSRADSPASSRSARDRDVRSTRMPKPLRLLAGAAALMTTLGGGVAAAQTVMIRNGPPSTSVEVLLNDAPVGTGTTNQAGEVTIPVSAGTTITQKGIDANIYVDICDKVRRIQIVDRTKAVPPPGDTCDRREISGLFWVRTVNTIVFDLGGPA